MELGSGHMFSVYTAQKWHIIHELCKRCLHTVKPCYSVQFGGHSRDSATKSSVQHFNSVGVLTVTIVTAHC